MSRKCEFKIQHFKNTIEIAMSIYVYHFLHGEKLVNMF